MGTWTGTQSYKATPRAGAFRVVAASLPREQAKALRAYCIRTGTPISRLLGSLVTDWLTLNQPLNYEPTPSAPPVTSHIAALPATQRARGSTGKAEPDSVLQAIDEARAVAGKAHRD